MRVHDRLKIHASVNDGRKLDLDLAHLPRSNRPRLGSRASNYSPWPGAVKTRMLAAFRASRGTGWRPGDLDPAQPARLITLLVASDRNGEIVDLHGPPAQQPLRNLHHGKVGQIQIQFSRAADTPLDVVTEARLQQALRRLRQGRTTILIAHRLSTVVDATTACSRTFAARVEVRCRVW